MQEQVDTEELVVDFVGGAVGHRFRSGEGRGQALAVPAVHRAAGHLDLDSHEHARVTCFRENESRR